MIYSYIDFGNFKQIFLFEKNFLYPKTQQKPTETFSKFEANKGVALKLYESRIFCSVFTRVNFLEEWHSI